MLGITHTINTLAIITTPLLLGYELNSEYVIFIYVCLVGVLFPDIDEPNSTMGKKLKFFSYPINILFGHRTITHNAIISILTILFGAYNNYNPVIAFGLGMLIHIMQDSVTYQGVKGAFFPFQKFNYNFVLLPRIFRFAVGSITEYIIFTSSCVYVLFVAYKTIL